MLLSLTREGKARFRDLDRKSHETNREHLSRLSLPARQRLLRLMREMQSLMSSPAAERNVVIRGHRVGDIGWAIERHGRLYAEEFGWNEHFEALVATLFANFVSGHDPERERMWVAEVDGERAGCVFVVRNADDASAAQLRCLLVDPSARGLGIGKRLVGECVDFATRAGYAKMLLWTNDILVAARRIYEAAGFSLASESAHRSFGKDLVGQIWTRSL